MGPKFSTNWHGLQGRSQEFVLEGTKGVPSVPSKVHSIHGQSPGWGLGAKPQKPDKHAENSIQCYKFCTIERKNFQHWEFGRGTCPPCSLPYAPDGLKKFIPALVLFWTMEEPKDSSEGWELGGTKRRLVKFKSKLRCISLKSNVFPASGNRK